MRPGLRQGAFELLKVILKSFGGLLAALALAVLALVAALSATEYRPAQAVYAGGAGGEPRTLSVVTWNIGYGGLGRESDFFMDGGSQIHPLGRQIVEKNLAGIAVQLEALPCPFAWPVRTANLKRCLLDVPLGENTQRYGIDGFWLSPNGHLTGVRGVDAGFEFSDHNPVRLEIVLE